MHYFQIFAIIGALSLFVLVIDFIRRGLLKEKYSVLWLGLSTIVILLSLRKQLLDGLATRIGIAYPPSLLFLVAFIFVLMILLHFSVVISVFHERNKTLAQELTLLKNAFKEAGFDLANPARKDAGKDPGRRE